MFRLTTHVLITTAFITFPSLFEKPVTSSNICPKVIMQCNSVNDCCDSPFEFSARIENIRPTDKPTFKWHVSQGKIISGQGTLTIKIDSSEVKGGIVYAVLEVNGLEAHCKVSASISQNICDPEPTIEIDAYGNISFKKEKSRLDRFAKEFKERQKAQAYLVAYNNSRARAERAKQYLVKKHKIEVERIVIINGGRHENLTTALYVVPPGAPPPTVNQIPIP